MKGDEVAISSKQVREVEFRERMRGYHQDDVDEFLEQVARGIDVLESQLSEAKVKIANYEANPPVVSSSTTAVAPEPQPSVAVGDSSDFIGASNDLIQRTLLLAQKAADEVVADAKASGDRMLAEAKRKSEEIVEQANTKANAVMEERAKQLTNEVDSLQTRRAALIDEMRGLALVIGTARDEMRSSLVDLVDRIEQALVFELPVVDLRDGTADTVKESDQESQNLHQDSEPEAAVPSMQSMTSVDAGQPKSESSSQEADLTVGYQYGRSNIEAEDATLALPLSNIEESEEYMQREADFSFGRPTFQLLDGEAPSAPVLFDDDQS